jgi:hypothetical protein
MNTDDTVLTLLRSAGLDDAPALTVQLDDVVTAGRRRRLRHRALATGAGLAVAAGLFAAVAVQAGDDQTGVGPTEPDQSGRSDDSEQVARVDQQQEEYTAHMMPALLKEVVIGPMEELPPWEEFRIDAFSSSDTGPLPEGRWTQATGWPLAGRAPDGAVSLSLDGDNGGATEGAPEDYCTDYLSQGALECRPSTLPDGRIVVEMWEKPATFVEGSWGLLGVTSLGPDDAWYVRSVKVYEEGSGYVVTMRQATQAASLEQARHRGWLTEQELYAGATDPQLNLADSLSPKASGGSDGVPPTAPAVTAEQPSRSR